MSPRFSKSSHANLAELSTSHTGRHQHPSEYGEQFDSFLPTMDVLPNWKEHISPITQNESRGTPCNKVLAHVPYFFARSSNTSHTPRLDIAAFLREIGTFSLAPTDPGKRDVEVRRQKNRKARDAANVAVAMEEVEGIVWPYVTEERILKQW